MVICEATHEGIRGVVPGASTQGATTHKILPAVQQEDVAGSIANVYNATTTRAFSTRLGVTPAAYRTASHLNEDLNHCQNLTDILLQYVPSRRPETPSVLSYPHTPYLPSAYGIVTT